MNGVDMMQKFQEFVDEKSEENSFAAYNQNTLIVGMSATADNVDQSDAYQYGMHFFCSKPTNMDFMAIVIDVKRTSTDIDEAVRLITKHEAQFFKKKTCPTEFKTEFEQRSSTPTKNLLGNDSDDYDVDDVNKTNERIATAETVFQDGSIQAKFILNNNDNVDSDDVLLIQDNDTEQQTHPNITNSSSSTTTTTTTTSATTIQSRSNTPTKVKKVNQVLPYNNSIDPLDDRVESFP